MFRFCNNNSFKAHASLIMLTAIFLCTQVIAVKEISQNKITLNDLSYLKNYFYKHHQDTVMELNFWQSRSLGNCGMIAAMATLALDKEIYNKVVPEGQNLIFNPHQCLNNDPLLFTFNLYKQGKLRKVVVNESLPIDERGFFIYSASLNLNFVGPLLEKALVELHFGGKYELTRGVSAAYVLSSMTDCYIEEYPTDPFGSSFDAKDLIRHGMKTRSQMAVYFKEDNKKYLMHRGHYYTLVGMKDLKVVLYNQNGRIFAVPRFPFFSNVLGLDICYFENKIFKIPEIKTSVELNSSWANMESTENEQLVVYDLLVLQDDTEILINFMNKVNTFNHKVRTFFILTYDKQKEGSGISKIDLYNKKDYSLRKNMKRGKYKVAIIKQNKVEMCESCGEFSDENKVVFRLSASKTCSVENTSEEETKLIGYVLSQLLDQKF